MEKDLDYWKDYYRGNKLSLSEEVSLIIGGDYIQLRAYIETNELHPRSLTWFRQYASEELIQIYESKYY